MTTGRTNSGAVGPFPIGHNQVILSLQKGDTVSLRIKPKSKGFVSAFANAFRSPSDVSFSGHLLFKLDQFAEEDETDEDVMINSDGDVMAKEDLSTTPPSGPDIP